MHTRTTPTALSAAALCLFALPAPAGPLDPPAGPIAGTAKPLAEVEPRIAINAANTPGDADSLFRITAPGSYYLTGNLQGVAARHGIEIASSNVSVDLMGFELIGVVGSLDGVSATINNSNTVRVANGTVSNWGQSGINLQSSFIRSVIVESVAAHANGTSGIAIHDGVVRACTASGNVFAGIRSTEVATISDCSTIQNTGVGFHLSNNSVIIGCSAAFNTGDGIFVANQCYVLNCTSNGNGNGGDGAGIHATGPDNRIDGNNVLLNDRGIDADAAGNFIIRNTASGNTTTNYDIAINNVYGPIIDRTAPASPAAVGNAAASVLTTTDPWANFAY